MKLALFGATGMIGSRILEEALSRGHQVTAIVREPSRVPQRAHVTCIQADAGSADSVAGAVAGHDAVMSAVSPGLDNPHQLVDMTRTLIDGVRKAGVKRLVAVGGAGSLQVAPGVKLVDSPGFPEAWKSIALAHEQALKLYFDADLDWTNISPAALIEPGERTGKYRTDPEKLLSDAAGQSRISAEDYAVALLDEVEHPKFVRQRFGVAY